MGRRREERRKGNKERRRRLEAKRKGLEKWKELKEREKRRRNVMVKGIEMKGEGIEGEVRKIWEELGLSARIEEIKDIGRGNGKERTIVIIKMEDRKGKMEVMRKKVALRGEW